MPANPLGLPKSLRNADGDVRVVRTAVDYHNLVARGYGEIEDKPKSAPARKADADAAK